MKNSAWYHKLWRSKLEELPVKDDADSAWTGMKELLDSHMPGSGTGNGPVSPSPGNNIISLLTYLVPAAAIIASVIYFSSPMVKGPGIARVNKVKARLDSQDHSYRPDSSSYGAVNTQHSELLLQKQKAPGTLRDQISSSGGAVAHVPAQTLSFSGDKSIRLNSMPGEGKMVLPAVEERLLLPYTGLVTHFSERAPAGQLPVMVVNAALFINTAAENSREIKRSNKERKVWRSVVRSNDTQSISDAGLLSPPVDEPGGNQVQGSSAEGDNNTIGSSPGAAVNRNNKKGKSASSGKTAEQKNDKVKTVKAAKAKRDRKVLPPLHNYGLEAGMNTGSGGQSFYLGMFRSFEINNHWLINTGLRFNGNRQLRGEYSHPSYYRPDSLPPFTITDSRKIRVLDVPLNLEYRISRTVSFQAGPVLSLLLNQSDKNGRVAPMADQRDTLYHSKEIISAINNTSVNKIGIGFNAGISFHLKQLEFAGKYQLLSPYRVSSNLGSYKKTYNTFQIGVSYRFK